VVSISFFKFRKGKKWWAFKNVPAARTLLKNNPELTFAKFMGSGAGRGFSVRPDFNVYCLLLVFKDDKENKQKLLSNAAYQLYANESKAQWNVMMQPIGAHGYWDKQQPFATGVTELQTNQQVGVITRASIKKKLMWQFWKFVPEVSKQIGQNREVIFSKGIGEAPLIEQATFSIWPNQDAIKKFAYQGKNHAEAVKKTRQLNWYSEELFARFAIVETFGSNESFQ